MTTLKDHLVKILKSRKFSVHERDGYLYGTRDDVSVVMMTAGDLIYDHAQDFVKNFSEFPGRKVIASLKEADEGLQRYLQENGVHYWGREEIEHELGNLQLESLEDPRSRSLMEEVIQDEFPQKPTEPHEQAVPVIVESIEQKSESIVKPNFSLDEVKYLARHEIEGYKFDLELVPHYLFHYIISYDEGKQRAGIAAVNALTSQVETWRWGFELVDSIDTPHFKREPKIDFEVAKQIANDMVTREYRSLTETVKDFGHSEIIERKQPKKESMLLEPKGLVYLPVWCVEGSRGAMIVNSSSGKIISEHLHNGERATEAKLG